MQSTRELIENELILVENKIADLIGSENEINSAIKNFITGSSKRIRSIFGILYLKANNKQITKDIINVITAGEIIHNASLLHDDVIDNSEFRRGEKTIGAKFSPQIAILAGDLLLSAAVKLIMEIGNSKLLEIFVNCTDKMSKAEINQYLLRGKAPSENTYISICEGKTSSLFEAILQSVAILSELDREKAKSLARNFGVLFQIKNDLEPYSAKQDLKNHIQTARAIFGVEKTLTLSDNYKCKYREIIEEFENKVYSEALLDLADNI